jgi:hypothetical protein
MPRDAQRERNTPRNLRVIPDGTEIPEALRRVVFLGASCTGAQLCVLLYQPNGNRAVLVSSDCPQGNGTGSSTLPLTVCGVPDREVFYLRESAWERTAQPQPTPEQARALRAQVAPGLRAGRVEVREVPRRQVFVDGRPVGDAFE